MYYMNKRSCFTCSVGCKKNEWLCLNRLDNDWAYWKPRLGNKPRSLLNVGDVVQVISGFVKDKIGTVVEDQDNKPNTYKLSFESGWCGWHERNNLRIINRVKKI